MRRFLTSLLAASLLLAGCGDDDDVATEDPATGTDTAPETETDDTSSTTERPTSSTTSGAAGELPGERIDIFPYEDTVLAVVGVEADDVLNVRDAPGPGQDVVGEARSAGRRHRPDGPQPPAGRRIDLGRDHGRRGDRLGQHRVPGPPG